MKKSKVLALMATELHFHATVVPLHDQVKEVQDEAKNAETHHASTVRRYRAHSVGTRPQDPKAGRRPARYWYGHDRPNDARFHVAQPFEHGRFEHFGPSFHYNVVRVDPGQHRFWLPQGVLFEVAACDWAECSDWCWNCGDDFVIYEDADQIGWYLLYNIETGGYVHVIYMGS